MEGCGCWIVVLFHHASLLCIMCLGALVIIFALVTIGLLFAVNRQALIDRDISTSSLN